MTNACTANRHHFTHSGGSRMTRHATDGHRFCQVAVGACQATITGQTLEERKRKAAAWRRLRPSRPAPRLDLRGDRTLFPPVIRQMLKQEPLGSYVGWIHTTSRKWAKVVSSVKANGLGSRCTPSVVFRLSRLPTGKIRFSFVRLA
jgi:hypothetical protein